MKKIFSVLPGLVGGLLSVIFLNQLFKWIIASCFISGTQLFFLGLYPTLNINFSGIPFFRTLLIIVSPLLFSLIVIELASFILKKLEKEFFRINVIIYILLNIGFLIFNILLGIFALILRSHYSNDWASFLEASGYTYNEKLAFMMFVMVLLFAYLNYTTKKIKNFIPVINKLDEKK